MFTFYHSTHHLPPDSDQEEEYIIKPGERMEEIRISGNRVVDFMFLFEQLQEVSHQKKIWRILEEQHGNQIKNILLWLSFTRNNRLKAGQKDGNSWPTKELESFQVPCDPRYILDAIQKESISNTKKTMPSGTAVPEAKRKKEKQ